MAIEKLPSKKVRQTLDFQELVQFYYGPPGVGKTTFANNLPKPNLFVATEDGQRALTAYVQRVNSWEEFLEVITLFEKGDGGIYQSVTIDTVDNLMTFCEDYVCKRLRIQHMSDEEWGKGWAALRSEFKKAINRLQAIGVGTIFISHAKEVEIKSRSLKIHKFVPTIGKQGKEVLIPLVDEMFFFTTIETSVGGKTKTERLIYCQPGETWEAKDRMGVFPESMPMDTKALVKVYQDTLKTK